MKKAAILLFVFSLLLGCSFTPSQSLGNTNGNLANFGYKVKVRDGIVFANSRDHMRIYRSKSDGSLVSKLSDRGGVYLNVLDEWVYFMSLDDDYAIVRVKSDGSAEQVVSSNAVFPYGGMIIINGWIYYVNADDGNRIYKMTADGSINEMFIDVSARRINGSEQGLVYIEVSDVENTLVVADLKSAERKVLVQDVGELAVVFDDWVYFNKKSDANKLYRVSLDGSNESKVNDIRVYALNENNGRLYFSDLDQNYRLSSAKLDGSDMKIVSEDMSSDLLFLDGWLYYLNHSDSGREYRIKGNDKEKVITVPKATPLSSDESVFEGMGNSNSNLLSGGYFVSINDDVVFVGSSEELQGMYRFNISNTDFSVEHISPDQGRSLNVWKDWVYYINESDYSSIYRMRSDGSETQIVLDQSVGSLLIKGNWMYFISHSDNSRIYRAKVDGTELMKISESEGIFSISLDGDWLVYANGQGQTMVKVKLDGSEEQVVTSFSSTYLTTDSGWIYYGDDNTRVALSKVKLDGTENQKLITTMASNVHIARNYIFYYDGQLSVVRRMDLDGSNIMDITVVGDYGQFHVIDDRLFMFDNQKFEWVSMDLDGNNTKVLE
ncbi:MAG: DUF5050 domain-containing protein [Erysipelothrix sp.]|nr:DUF5050 domain-containing protein [Erysipelothrix sp.]